MAGTGWVVRIPMVTFAYPQVRRESASLNVCSQSLGFGFEKVQLSVLNNCKQRAKNPLKVCAGSGKNIVVGK